MEGVRGAPVKGLAASERESRRVSGVEWLLDPGGGPRGVVLTTDDWTCWASFSDLIDGFVSDRTTGQRHYVAQDHSHKHT